MRRRTKKRMRRRRKVDAVLKACALVDYLVVWKMNCIGMKHSADKVHHD